MAHADAQDLERAYREIAALNEWLRVEHQDFRNHVGTVDKLRSEIRGRMMLLTAGVVGVVIPLLAGQAGVVQARTARMAAIAWLISLSAAVVGQAVDRFTTAWVTRRFNAQIAAEFDHKRAIAEAFLTGGALPDSHGELSKRADALLDGLDKARSVRSGLATAEDAVVYGAFIVGVVVLVWGLN